MSKLLVLLSGQQIAIRSLAEGIAEGASSVRFTETELRQLEGGVQAGAGSAPRYRTLESAEEITEYHAIIVGADGAGGVPEGLRRFFEQLEHAAGHGRFRDLVASAFVPAPRSAGGQAVLWPVVTELAKLGALIVSPSMLTDKGTPDDGAAVLALGKRVATVTEWVRHARGHEAAHGHTH